MRKSLFAALLLAPLTAGAQTLTIGAASPVTTVDPQFYNTGPNNALTAHIFDRLVERDAHARHAGLGVLLAGAERHGLGIHPAAQRHLA